MHSALNFLRRFSVQRLHDETEPNNNNNEKKREKKWRGNDLMVKMNNGNRDRKLNKRNVVDATPAPPAE